MSDRLAKHPHHENPAHRQIPMSSNVAPKTHNEICPFWAVGGYQIEKEDVTTASAVAPIANPPPPHGDVNSGADLR
jgi:hypothetical protein